MQLTKYRRHESGERELSLELAITLSKFYDVPINYIAGTSDKINTSVTDLTVEEMRLVQNYRKLSDEDKKETYRNIGYFKIKNPQSHSIETVD